MNRKEDQSTSSLPTRRLVGAPPSAAVMRIAAKELKVEQKRRPINPVETEESADDDSETEKTAEETEEVDDSKTNEEQPPEKKRRKRRKKRIRLTDTGLKTKKKVDKKEKMVSEQKDKRIEDDQDMDSDPPSAKPEPQKEEPPPPKPKERPKLEDLSHFQLFCDNILRKLVMKDPEGYFANPVSDEEAPDYKNLIQNPMAFAIIRDKIEQDEYPNLSDFRSDVELIVSNAQTYNPEGSLFYLAAEKLSTLIKYYFSEKYLLYLIYALPFGRMVPIERVGVKIPNERKRIQKQLIANTRERERMNALIKDTETPRAIIESAPKFIRSRLTSRRPNCNLVYFDNKNGALALNLLTSNNLEDEEGYNEEGGGNFPQKLKLGDLVKPLEQGNPGMLIEAFEPKINQQFPLISYTNPGPFASFAPQWDSTWATLSKRDSQLLLSCYGDQDNVSDAFSLRQMVENVDDGNFVDDMFDGLTDGEHSKTIAALEGKEMEKSNVVASNPLDEKLEQTGNMLQQLAAVQNKRLSQPPPTAISYALVPDQEETHLANSIAQDLTKQILESNVRPGDIVSPKMVHQALGLDADDFDVISEFLDV
ncbi:unnamed protein product [Meloidogyne enterolobii]|uniref:Uncharacterized protein n=1 Tax=Meloidogyne enterolobii TaxID=390850 RepID=A0ACB0XUW8_MELEN